jgi:hypothetical protein
MPVDRERILDALRQALQPRPDVWAFWEGGSAATGRLDAWSDMDLQLICDDDRVQDVFGAAEEALRSVSPIELCWRVPEPAWHGHSQRFYRLRDAGPYLMIDLTVMRRSASMRFTEPEQHGRVLVYFDRSGLLAPPPFDAEAFRARMRADLDNLRDMFPILQPLVEKELLRGRVLDALSFYHSLTLRPLVTVLGMLHRPLRYTFGLRYLNHDFPRDVVQQLEALAYVADPQDLLAKHARAQALFQDAVGRLDLDAIPLEQLSRAARG